MGFWAAFRPFVSLNTSVPPPENMQVRWISGRRRFCPTRLSDVFVAEVDGETVFGLLSKCRLVTRSRKKSRLYTRTALTNHVHFSVTN